MLEQLLKRVARTGLQRGSTGSRTWFVIAFVAGGIRLLRYVSRSGEEVLYRTQVVEGDQFEITTRAPGKR
jgi:hypothetical protein